MIDQSRKRLPEGEWLYLKGLPVGTQAAELSAWFHKHGLRIDADCISIKDFGRVACAFVSLRHQVVLDMFREALLDVPPFDGNYHFGIETVKRRATIPA